MTLKERIDQDMKDAMRARDEGRLKAVRLLRAAIQRREVDERIQLDDRQILGAVEKLIKQSRDAEAQFRKAGRIDLADIEQADLAVWGAYLPEPLSAEEIERLIGEAVAETGAASAKDIGKVVGWLKPKLQGRADLGQVSAQVKSRLSV
ncbi:MAG: GatB/YqeY domain-containing protein [Acidiferrobacteraceae bacterium]